MVVSEMTYTVSSGTLNSTIPHHCVTMASTAYCHTIEDARLCILLSKRENGFKYIIRNIALWDLEMAVYTTNS